MEFLSLSAKRGAGEIGLDIASWKHSCAASLSFADFTFWDIFSQGKMVERLEQLTEKMNQINLGLRKVTVVSQSKDEIGVLVRTFTRMMDEINKLISQVYEAKIKLQKQR